MTSTSLTGSDLLQLRTLSPADYDAIINVWNLAGLPYKPLGRDSPGEMKRQMELDPEMFLGAFQGGDMVGIVMGSYDSRKAWINRLAVVPEHRKKGIAMALVEEMEKRLKARGFRIIAVLVEGGHDASLALFRKMGYSVFEGITYMTKRDSQDI